MIFCKVLLTTALLSFGFFGFSQKMTVTVYMENVRTSPANDTIYYDFSRPLSWNDFKGKPDDNHFGGAVTASGFAFNSEMNSVDNSYELVIGVYSFFTRHDSWKKTFINSDYHLLHEQRHFDITRLGAEKLVHELQNARITINNYQTLVNKIFEKVYDENNALQNQYDLETKHSINIVKQKEWNDKIAAQLKVIRQNATVLN